MTATRRTKVFLDGFTFTEGPRWHDGHLWFSDFFAGAVWRSDASGKLEKVASLEDEPSGLGWLPDGRLLVVSMHDRKVLRLEEGGLQLHADLSGIATSNCNDMVVAGDGTAYVGNFGAVWNPEEPEPPTPAKLARITPDGDVHVAAEDLLFPNGMAITPDGSTLFVAEMRANRITAFDIEAGGGLGNRRVWAETEGAPDGICLDEEGKIWAAFPMTGQVVRVEEGGRVCDRVEPTADLPTACMLGGPERRSLFVTTGTAAGPEEARRERPSRIERVEVEVPGAGWP